MAYFTSNKTSDCRKHLCIHSPADLDKTTISRSKNGLEMLICMFFVLQVISGIRRGCPQCNAFGLWNRSSKLQSHNWMNVASLTIIMQNLMFHCAKLRTLVALDREYRLFKMSTLVTISTSESWKCFIPKYIIREKHLCRNDLIRAEIGPM